MYLFLESMSVSGLGLTNVSVDAQQSAEMAIGAVDRAIAMVSTQRAALGAIQNRLEHKINSMDIASENLSSAESRIRDADMAKEMTALAKEQIIQQAASAMLAQANQMPQNVLELLR